jgi:L-threonylcarbamoyladenylate synthase
VGVGKIFEEKEMIISRIEFLQNKEKYISEMKKGKIFIYPTDTIYGIGCDALNSKSVLKIREIKRRNEKPFSIFVPRKDWIRDNCAVDELIETWLKKLPGAFTFILELKNKKAISKKVNESGNSIGVRIIDIWFSEIVKKLDRPFVTTSVNFSGEKFAESINEINNEILKNVDYVIDDGRLGGKGSKIVKLINGKVEVIRY